MSGRERGRGGKEGEKNVKGREGVKKRTLAKKGRKFKDYHDGERGREEVRGKMGTDLRVRRGSNGEREEKGCTGR